MHSSHTTSMLTDHQVIDQQGAKVGEVVDVIPDPATLEPRYLVVDPGVFKAPHYVPVRGSYQTVRGDIVVPYDAASVRHAPKAQRDHIVTPELEHEILAHYGLAV